MIGLAQMLLIDVLPICWASTMSLFNVFLSISIVFFAENSVYYLSRAVREKEKGACHTRHCVRNAEIALDIYDIRAITQFTYIRASVYQPAKHKQKQSLSAHFFYLFFFVFLSRHKLHLREFKYNTQTHLCQAILTNRPFCLAFLFKKIRRADLSEVRPYTYFKV